MNITTIELPIYYLDLVLVIDQDWSKYNKKFKLGLSEADYLARAWTIHDDSGENDNEIFLLLKPDNLDYWTICHELYHIITKICLCRGIDQDPKNDEPLAYLQAYIGQEIFKFRDKYVKENKTLLS